MTAWIAERVSPWMAILLYFVPLVFCHVFYFVRTVRNWSKDRAKRDLCTRYNAAWVALSEQDKGHPYAHIPEALHGGNCLYHPTDTIGSIIGRVLVSWIPMANLWAAMFDLAPGVFEKLFNWIERVFNQPLVPPKES